MLLHTTPIAEIHYDPKYDVLYIKWPDVKEKDWVHIENTLALIRADIDNYYIKRFLVDARQTVDSNNKTLVQYVAGQFLKAISGTTIQKVARLQSAVPAREALTKEVIKEFYPKEPDPQFSQIQFRNFSDEDDAIKWLLEA